MQFFIRSAIATMLLMGTSYANNVSEDYPTRPIRMVAPFAPGGGSDVVARLVAEKMGPLLGQSVIVENRPGASGMIGADIVAKASPDGYTILMTNSALTSNPALYSKISYDTERDLVPVIDLASSPTLLAAHPGAPFNTMEELAQYAKKHPNTVSVGTPGAGQMSHLAAEMVSQASGTELLMVHYKGTANSVNDLLGGTIMMSFGTVPGFIKYIKANQLKPIAIAGAQRLPALPDVPAVGETYPGFEMNVWFGTFVPQGTPKPVIDKLHTVMADVLKDPAIRARFADEGLIPGGMSQEKFDALFRTELTRWKQFVNDRNINLNN
jgi:tripartite-type tricarboxylate transporter receptor subunit TctC